MDNTKHAINPTNSKRRTDKRQISIQNEGTETLETVVTGRVLWALEALIEGPCTPISRPAPRWSDYVFRLRNEGVVIETEFESHGGQYPGTHAKYHLKSQITFLDQNDEVAA